MLVNREVDRNWDATKFEGVERCLFRQNKEGGRDSIIRMKKGSHFPEHTHKGDESLLILNGRILIGGVELDQGDYLHTEAGEKHDIVALTDTVLFVSSQKATPVIK